MSWLALTALVTLVATNIYKDSMCDYALNYQRAYLVESHETRERQMREELLSFPMVRDGANENQRLHLCARGYHVVDVATGKNIPCPGD